MDFLAIFIGVLLLTYLGSAKMFQHDQWFTAWGGVNEGLRKYSALHLLVVVFVPALVLWLVYATLGKMFWGLVELALSVLILLYCIGRGKYKSLLNKAKNDIRQQGLVPAVFDTIEERLEAMLVVDYSVHHRQEDSVYERYAQLRSLFIYAGFQRVFVTLFWFSLLGPVAALVYRLSFLYAQSFEKDSSALGHKLLYLMEWPASRLVGLCYGLVGDFASVTSLWLSMSHRFGETIRWYLSPLAYSALNLKSQWLSQDFIGSRSEAELNKLASDELASVQTLYSRSIICMLVLVAIFEIAFF